MPRGRALRFLGRRRCDLAVIGLIAMSACGAGGVEATQTRSGRAVQTTTSAAPVRIALRKRVLEFVDRRRTVRRRSGRRVPRRIVTVVRYPEVLSDGSASREHRFPLVVFAHGYALSPGDYRGLLHAWARAGYVVAAPVLPGENAAAPGGPDRGDLLNQPADLRFVIDRLLAASKRGRALDFIDPSRIAVAGHSDGGDTALAVAYLPRYRSRRVDAAIILAGASLPGSPTVFSPRPGPPLLAVQGSADPINLPTETAAYYRRVGGSKFLLTFNGAGHFGPYMTQQPQIGVLKRVSTAFLDRTLKGGAISRRRLVRLGTRSGVSTLQVGGRTAG